WWRTSGNQADRRAFDHRLARHLGTQTLIDRHSLRPRRVAIGREKNLRDRDPSGVVTGWCTIEIYERAHRRARSSQENDDDRDLRGDEHTRPNASDTGALRR